MMAQASPAALVTLHGTPEKCSLKNVKAAIVEIVGNDESLRSLMRCKDHKGKIISGKIEVLLNSEEDLQKLLQHPVIDYEDNDNLYALKVTRSRPRTSINAAPTKTENVRSPHTKEKHFKVSPRISKNISANLRSSDDDTSSSDEDTKPKFKSGFGTFKGRSPRRSSSDDDTTSEEDIKSDVRFSKSQQEVQRFSRFRKGNEEKQPMNTSVNKLMKTPIDWFHLLQSDPDIFEEYCDRCVMVQDSLDTITSKQLLSSLESQLTATEIRKIVRLHDGILVVLHDDKAASKVVKSKFLDVNGTKLQVYLKPVPPVYNDRILIKGNFKGNDREEIEDMLKCCTETGFKVKKLPLTNMFLVSFEENVDVDDVASAMSDLPLQEMHPKTIKLCQSDCVKVENVKQGAANDAIKLAFMNRKLNSGDITLVQQTAARNTALVYFGSYKDAAKVVEKSKKMEIKVSKKPVQVSLYCPGIKGSVDYSSYTISQFRYELKVDGDVIRFIQKSRNLKHDLYKEMGDLAEVEFEEDTTEESKFSAKLKPLLSEEESHNMEQDNFENDCKSRIQQFCSKFSSKFRKYEDDSRDRVRKEHQWDEQEDGILEVSVKRNDLITVFVRWEPKGEDAIKVTGNPKHVSAFLDWFQEKCNFVREVERFSENDFQILMDCGIVEEASAYLDENVVVKVDKSNKQVIFEGSKDVVAPAVTAVRNSSKRVQDCDVSFLHGVQKQFLRCLLQSKDSKDHIDIVDYLRSKLREADIKVCLTLNEDTLRLVYSSQKRTEQLEKAKEKIKDLIKYKAFSCQNNFDDLMEEDEWKELKTKVESSGTLLIFRSTKNAEVQLVGLPQGFEKELKRIKVFFEDNIEVEKRVDLPYPETMFISSFPTEIEAHDHLNKTEWYEEPGGIHVKGKACHVRKAEIWIEEISHTIKTSTKTLSLPGAADFFRGKSGTQFLKTTSKDTQCVIQLDSVESEEWGEAEKWAGSMSESPILKKQEREYVRISDDEEAIQGHTRSGWLESGKNKVKEFGSFFGLSESPLTPEQDTLVDVSVINGDILQSDCDVIVNTTGDDYNLKRDVT